jgi:CDP-diacylglycerol--glycerol-3-phosphate 3-phosphatidyltransferase
MTTSLWIGLAIFVVASLTDFLDGYLARKLHLVTDLGKFMDPLADKMLVTAAMIALIEKSDLLPAWVVVIILLREFAISGIRLIAANKQFVIAANYLGKIKTVTQMMMIIVLLLPIQNMGLQFVGTLLVYASLILTILSGGQYIWQNRAVLKE